MFWLVALLLLGIERFLYGYIYHFPESFKTVCKGSLRTLLDHDEGKFWLVAKHLGVAIKVFQFSVIGYDLLIRCSLAVPPFGRLVAGAALIGIGQLLNGCVYQAIGAVGVYYGSQLGYDVPWCNGFPYNLGISDPQYCGVILCIWGLYLSATADGNIISGYYLVPWLETFWYLTSMKVLEHQKRGSAVLQRLGASVHGK
uniref:phosphatidyl-N-methylethanolamine N-methyltransferase n=1 Tax=Pyrodinium bahamense TaxID=73915 RepID=A0A7S0A4S6_9DINO|mmetsp:Transcript_2228/g.6326  ORF Transcript_2228/g.6326 Transcript_2228/m.6326 type:complete len:199 (+) Transcript_2228:96-692(+)|eukprot:CAMPEP_0179101610 /NCGR_PEP_ID=MMETSP0796-20121207/46988_1 /TAXON_ID=73915 /ORGANISM="Pyrodinium bahamense, Strain pbaha01" /LENGTH=198 /DNA_ID=CAMNT_0020799465 /DNA_START=237 /DNA_END=833 /DNA_ORIENTATION=-